MNVHDVDAAKPDHYGVGALREYVVHCVFRLQAGVTLFGVILEPMLESPIRRP
jgi:hypothetical protein